MRFLLFSGWDYYPAGGANDLHSLHATQEEAISEFKSYLLSGHDSWAHIYDIETQAIVWEWNR